MADVFMRIFSLENLINSITFLATVLALVFTLYFWLLDHLSEEESEFISHKEKILKVLRNSYETFEKQKPCGSAASDPRQPVLADNNCLGSEQQASAPHLNKEDVPEESDPLKAWIDSVQKVNSRMEVVMNYRFWGRSPRREAYNEISAFCRDSRYLASTLIRWQEALNDPASKGSLAGIPVLSQAQIDDIQKTYRSGLSLTIEFLENWV